MERIVGSINRLRRFKRLVNESVESDENDQSREAERPRTPPSAPGRFGRLSPTRLFKRRKNSSESGESDTSREVERPESPESAEPGPSGRRSPPRPRFEPLPVVNDSSESGENDHSREAERPESPPLLSEPGSGRILPTRPITFEPELVNDSSESGESDQSRDAERPVSPPLSPPRSGRQSPTIAINIKELKAHLLTVKKENIQLKERVYVLQSLMHHDLSDADSQEKIDMTLSIQMESMKQRLTDEKYALQEHYIRIVRDHDDQIKERDRRLATMTQTLMEKDQLIQDFKAKDWSSFCSDSVKETVIKNLEFSLEQRDKILEDTIEGQVQALKLKDDEISAINVTMRAKDRKIDEQDVEITSLNDKLTELAKKMNCAKATVQNQELKTVLDVQFKELENLKSAWRMVTALYKNLKASLPPLGCPQRCEGAEEFLSEIATVEALNKDLEDNIKESIDLRQAMEEHMNTFAGERADMIDEIKALKTKLEDSTALTSQLESKLAEATCKTEAVDSTPDVPTTPPKQCSKTSTGIADDANADGQSTPAQESEIKEISKTADLEDANAAADLKEQLDQARALICEKDQEIENLKIKLIETDCWGSSCDNIDALKEQVRSLAQEKADFEVLVEELRRQAAVSDEQSNNLRGEVDKLKQELEDLHESQKEKHAALEDCYKIISARDEELVMKNGLVEELMGKIEDLESAKEAGDKESLKIQAETSALSEHLNQLEEKNSDLNRDNAVFSAQTETLEADLREKNQENKKLERDFDSMKAEFEDLKKGNTDRIEKLEQDYHDSQAEASRQKEQVCQLNEKNVSLNNQITAQKDQIEAELAEMNHLNNMLRSAIEELESDKGSKTEALMQENNDFRLELNRLADRMCQLDEEKSELIRENDKITAQNDQLEADMATMKEKNESLKSDLDELDNLNAERAALSNEVASLNLAKEELKASLDKLTEENNKLKLDEVESFKKSEELDAANKQLQAELDQVINTKLVAISEEVCELTVKTNELTAQNDQLNRSCAELSDINENLATEKTKLQADLNTSIQENSDLKCEQRKVMDENSKLQSEIADLSDAKGKLKIKLDETITETGKYKSDCSTLSGEISELRMELDKINEEKKMLMWDTDHLRQGQEDLKKKATVAEDKLAKLSDELSVAKAGALQHSAEIEKITAENEKITAENEKISAQKMHLEEEMKSLKINRNTAAQHLERLNAELKMWQYECEAAKKQQGDAETISKRVSQSYEKLMEVSADQTVLLRAQLKEAKKDLDAACKKIQASVANERFLSCELKMYRAKMKSAGINPPTLPMAGSVTEDLLNDHDAMFDMMKGNMSSPTFDFYGVAGLGQHTLSATNSSSNTDLLSDAESPAVDKSALQMTTPSKDRKNLDKTRKVKSVVISEAKFSSDSLNDSQSDVTPATSSTTLQSTDAVSDVPEANPVNSKHQQEKVRIFRSAPAVVIDPDDTDSETLYDAVEAKLAANAGGLASDRSESAATSISSSNSSAGTVRVVGYVGDYNIVKEQIQQMRDVFSEMECHIRIWKQMAVKESRELPLMHQMMYNTRSMRHVVDDIDTRLSFFRAGKVPSTEEYNHQKMIISSQEILLRHALERLHNAKKTEEGFERVQINNATGIHYNLSKAQSNPEGRFCGLRR